MTMPDPTYRLDEIEAKDEWLLAWIISEHLNDNAPIGWSRFVPVARSLVERGFKREPAP